MLTLQFILENATIGTVQAAVKRFDVSGIAYSFRMSIINEFPEYRRCGLQLGLDISRLMEPFKTDWVTLLSVDQKIRNIQKKLSLLGKYHPDYLSLCLEHDSLVMINNELNKPINDFLKLYKKAQKNKDKIIRVIKKRERVFSKPA